MDELNLLFRPTIGALSEEDDIDAGNEDGLLYEQGIESEPVCIQEGETFDIPEGVEAIPADCECFLAGERDVDFCEKRNGFWINPCTSRLHAGRYQYMGHGVVQLIMQDDDLTIGMRETEIPEELSEMSPEAIEYWKNNIPSIEVKPGRPFEIRRYYEGVVLYPPGTLKCGEIERPINVGDALPAGEYLYEGEGVIDCLHPEEVESYSNEATPAMPIKAAQTFCRILIEVFPAYHFKYENECFFCLLDSKWVDIFAFTRQHDGDAGREWPAFERLGSEDEFLNKEFIGYQCVKNMIDKVRDSFFAPHQITVETKRIPTFTDFLKMRDFSLD